MNEDLTVVSVLVTPGAVLGTVCLAGHLWTRRHDASIAAAFRALPAPEPPTGDGEPASAPEQLATVTPLPIAHDRDRAA